MKLSYVNIKNICLLINKRILGYTRHITQFLTSSILVILVLYILYFIIIAIGNIAVTSGFYNFSRNHFDWLYQILQYFPRSEVDIIYAASIVVMLLLWLLIIEIFNAEKGMVILPFLVDPADKDCNGNATAELLIAELKRIMRIHSVNFESHYLLSSENKNLSATYPTKDIKEKAHLLQLNPKGENIDQNIQAIGTLGFGSTSIPIGSILIFLRNICPWADPGLIISGCLQKHGSDICLVSYVERENRSWHVRKKILNDKNISNEDLSVLVRELSYNIYYELLQLQSKQNILDILKSLLKEGDFSGKAPDHAIPSWEVFKYFTEAMDALQTYNITKERKDLDRARVSGLKAAFVDPYYNNPLYLLYNVGIAYINNLNKKDYYEAERLARYIVALRPDSSRAWYSWGLTLKFLTFNKEAIECYDKALFFDGFEKEKKNKIATDIYFMKAVSLRDLKHYDEAIMYFLKYFSEKENKKNGYAWGHYGITLEAKAKSLDKYVIRWDKIPGKDNANPGIDEKKLREFLMERWGKEWAKSEKIRKINSGAIKISHGNESIQLEYDNKENKVILKINDQEMGDFKAVMEYSELIINLDDEALSIEAEGLRDEAEEAFRKAIEFQHDFVSVHAALARIYRKWYVLSWEKIPDENGIPSEDGLKLKKFIMKNFHVNWLNEAKKIKINKNNDMIEITKEKKSISLKLSGDRTNVSLKEIIGGIAYVIGRCAVKKENDELKVYLRDPSKECNEAQKHKQTRKQNEYNRACYEINCGNESKARKLLETAIKEKQISRQWLEDDPDWDHVREKEQWFKDLLIYPANTFDANELISRIAIRRKLDTESGKNSFFFCEYDIADPRELAEKICKDCDMPSPIVKLKPEEKKNLKSYCEELNTKKILEYLCSDDRLEPYAIRVPYSIRKIFIEEKVKRSKELQKLLCNMLNKYLIDPNNVNSKRKLLEAAYPKLKAENFLKLSEDAEKALEEESLPVRARFHAVSGNDHNEALYLLYWALDSNQISTEEARFEPDFEFIRDKPRFKELMDRFSERKLIDS